MIFVWQKLTLALLIILTIIFPVFVFADDFSNQCSKTGYTVLTINGIFTDEIGAQNNADALRWKLDKNFNHQPLTVDYLHNPSHLAGIGDLAKVVYQKIFDDETVEDYDLVEMLKDVSDKVKTQKLLLVAHSQGNFYANSFYDTVAGKDGGVPKKSIGVYAVATPAGRVAGGGRWLTSDTDKIIADLVGNMPFKKIMEPNTRIVLAENDDQKGHNFSSVYLKYRGQEIVSSIQESLDKLQTNNVQSESPCLAPPKLTLAHKITGAVFAAADPLAENNIRAVVFAAQKFYAAGAFTVNGVKQMAAAINFSDDFAIKNEQELESEPKTEQKTEIKTEPRMENIVAESPFEAEKIVYAKNLLEKTSRQIDALRKTKTAEAAEKSLPPVLLEITPPASPPTWASEAAKTAIRDTPRIFHITMIYPGFGGGGGAAPQTATQNQNNNQNNSPQSFSAPSLTAPQCDYSLALDGCLLATTTINFSWSAVSGAGHYAINKNGEYSTTTDLSFTAVAADFSDYVFAVSAISFANSSATSTQTVSVATIPVAINEIAWMGTQASVYDEWLELRNNTGHTINLSQWAIESQDGAPYIALSGELTPHQYRILERRTGTIIISEETTAYGDGAYQWALGNGGEELTLYFASTTLDKTPAISGGVWAAGNNSATTSRKTMERIDSKQSGATSTNWATWGTNVDFIKTGADAAGNAILGTPGDCNSASFTNINGGQTIASSTTLEADNCYYVSAGVRVSASSTLAIEEGARVSLSQNNLYIDGVLDVNGEENNPVVFDSFSGEATTNRIRISGDNGTSTIDNAVFSDTGGIYINNGADVEITNTEFINNSAGLELNNGSAAVVENVSFASTTNEAVSAYNGSVVSVASTTISNTLEADAVGIYNSAISMASTTIINVLNGDGLGLYDSTTTVADVSVENVSGDGVAVYGGSISGNATIDGIPVEF